MLKNYLKVAVRNIVKQKAFSFINIFGLAVGMSICMTIMMLVADQMENDQHNPNKARIYRVNSLPYFQGNRQNTGTETATTTLALRDELINHYTGVERAARIMRGFGNGWIEFEPGNDINIPVSGFFADPDLLAIMDLELLYGDATTALVEPYSVVITEATAKKLFKVENPVGESFKVGKLGTYKVTGVIKDKKQKSHIIAEAYASMSTVNSLQSAGIFSDNSNSWYNIFTGWVYILLEEGTSVEEINQHLTKIQADHYASLPTPETVATNFRLQNLVKITPGPLLNNPIGPFMPWIIIYFLAALAGIVLITSCFNFTNLSIARSLSRAKEIGVRKVTGAKRSQIFAQFMSESVVVALFALALALVMVLFLKPMMEELAFTQTMHWGLSVNNTLYFVFIAFAITVGIMAGLFPSIVLSGFQPIKVLKNLSNNKLMSKMGLRKALLVMQFSISLIFILTVIVLYNQLDLFLHSSDGFKATNKVMIQKGETSPELLKTELLKNSNLTSVTMASHIPSAGINYGENVKRSIEDEQWQDLSYFAVDEDYLSNMGLELVAGKFYEAEAGMSNQNMVVINEAALPLLQFNTADEAIGQSIIFQRDSIEKQVIGIVKNYNHEMMAQTLRPLALIYSPEEYRLLQIAYNGTFDEAKKTVEQAWATVNPGLKVEVLDFQKEMSVMYEILFGSLVKIVGFVATVAIVISCLGLLGMATYTIQTRRKEIAVRKVLGSSNSALVLILSKGYLSILLIAILISVPTAYFLNTMWLQQFVTHTSVDVLTVSIGIFILGLFGLFTIGSQTLQALFVNPVDNLKED